MDSSRQQTRPKDAGPVIVFEPVQQRFGAGWRALAIAKAALLVWGGVSLAAVAAGAVVYAQNGSIPLFQSPARPDASPVLVASRDPAPKPEPVQVQPAPAALPGAAALPARPLTAPASVTKPAGLAGPVEVAQPYAEPLVEARLPQSRPGEPPTTGSLASPGEDGAPPRFRRLRDIRLRVPHVPGTPLRMPGPRRESDAVGRHIRQVWTSFPFDPNAGGEAWRKESRRVR